MACTSSVAAATQSLTTEVNEYARIAGPCRVHNGRGVGAAAHTTSCLWAVPERQVHA